VAAALMRTLLITLSLLLTGLAFVPGSTAMAPECPSAGTSQDTGVGAFGVYVSEDCSVDAFAFRGVICVGSWGGTAERDVGPVHAEASYCTPPGGLPPITATSGPCGEGAKQVAGVAVLYRYDDCSARLDVKFQECIWGGYWDTTEVGPLTVRVYKCGPPTQAAGASMAGPCGSEKQLGVGTLYLDQDCNARLDVKAYDCIWGGHWTTYGTGAAQVRVYSCEPATQTAAQPCRDAHAELWAGGVALRSDCSARVTVLDAYRVCRNFGMPAGDSITTTVGPLEASVGTCELR